MIPVPRRWREEDEKFKVIFSGIEFKRDSISKRGAGTGAGEIVHWLRALAALAGDWSSILSVNVGWS